ncbi:Uncharacterized protein Fot_31875 [Forsythia ovata]|uniref:Uncharacterized protein n=1 Tax=Forsythia ovata TaxID=205694 RepID=A0ABD1T664_9LAMI
MDEKSLYGLNKMDEKFKLIPDIYPTQRDWTTKADGNIDKLNEIIEEKPCLVLTPSKLSPPEESQFTEIKRVHSLLFGAYVQLEDSTGVLNANVIGEPTEKLFQCSSETLMQHSKMAIDKQQIFYVKATQRLPNKTEYKFEIIFVLDTCLAITEIEHSKVNKGKCLLYRDLPTKAALIEELSQPLAKRAMFQLPDEDIVAKDKIEKNTNDPNFPTALLVNEALLLLRLYMVFPLILLERFASKKL